MKSAGPTIGNPSKTSLQFFFMACYDIDRFREFVKSEGFSTTYDVDQETMDKILADDLELLKFGDRMIRQIMYGEETIPLKSDAMDVHLERRGNRFMSNCDSELIAVYIADRIDDGYSLEDAMRESIDELDGVFTYVVATRDALGMAKDVMAAKPMVLYESDDLIALASEEVAIRSIFPHEINTYDPYEGEVRVWQT